MKRSNLAWSADRDEPPVRTGIGHAPTRSATSCKLKVIVIEDAREGSRWKRQ